MIAPVKNISPNKTALHHWGLGLQCTDLGGTQSTPNDTKFTIMAKNTQVKQNRANEKYKVLVKMQTFIHCFRALNWEWNYLAVSTLLNVCIKMTHQSYFLLFTQQQQYKKIDM